MYEKIAQIIETVVGDGFTGEDYDRGWHDATKRIAIELANYLAQVRQIKIFFAIFKKNIIDTNQSEVILGTISS